ncbi:MAG: hypothetical protein H6612_01570 [Ignavibacteriales bacterium]|nr:hypothetical protein [Ignavibacteriales bacterium]MCB9209370.1 hypothetical protein [Ignavibacteriales bacterium]MCB9258013.1 hypothetical protein [Ignavibacteriales bacterium]
MKGILEDAVANRIVNGNNKILEKAIEKDFNEDRIIKIVTKEITDFIIKIYSTQKNI